MKQVCIVQATIKRYRVPFFDRLHARLADAGVALTVIYSEPNATERARGDEAELDPAYGRKVPARWLLGERLIFQRVGRAAFDADLVIVEQANKHLINYGLLARRRLGLQRVAFWGHGRNRQSRSPGGLAERLKRATAPHVDWWFAYTAGTARYLESIGVDPRRITDVQNSVDLTDFRAALAAIDDSSAARCRRELGISPEAPVALFCGGLYPGKHIRFLIEAVRLARSQLPSLELLIVGDGPDRAVASAAAQCSSFIHLLGPKFDADKAALFRIADLFVNPGLVGLAILDAFAAGLPLFTTHLPIDSPELEYLSEGENGLVTLHEPAAFARAIVQTIKDPTARARLRDGAFQSSRRYSIEEMAARFAQGVIACLEA